MVPPGASLVGPSANMMPSQSAHQPPAMYNPTPTAGYGVQLQGQPPSMMSLNKPPQAGILPPPPSNTGLGSVQHHQFPPPPKAGTQPTVGQSLQQFPPRSNQFPPPPSTGTHPPVGLPPQQVTPAPPNTEAQAGGPNQQAQAHSMPMSEQSQPQFGGLRLPNQPPIMSTMAGPPPQTSNINQFTNQSAVGAVQAAPPMMSAQQPPTTVVSAQRPPPTSTNVASSAITGGPPVLGMTSSNIGPPRAGHMVSNLSGPPLPSTGTIQAGMPPPPGNLITTIVIVATDN